MVSELSFNKAINRMVVLTNKGYKIIDDALHDLSSSRQLKEQMEEDEMTKRDGELSCDLLSQLILLQKEMATMIELFVTRISI